MFVSRAKQADRQGEVTFGSIFDKKRYEERVPCKDYKGKLVKLGKAYNFELPHTMEVLLQDGTRAKVGVKTCPGLSRPAKLRLTVIDAS